MFRRHAVHPPASGSAADVQNPLDHPNDTLVSEPIMKLQRGVGEKKASALELTEMHKFIQISWLSY